MVFATSWSRASSTRSRSSAARARSPGIRASMAVVSSSLTRSTIWRSSSKSPAPWTKAAPLQNWTLPEPLQHLRRLLEARMGNRGKREFIQALRLVEVFPETLVAAAALDAIRLGAISFDAVKQLVIAKVEQQTPNLSLGHHPYLPAANVKTTSATDYMVLVSGRAA